MATARNGIVLIFALFATLAVAQQEPLQSNKCDSLKSSSQPVFIATDAAMKLYVDQLRADPDAGQSGGEVLSVMLHAGLRRAWVRAQILVDEHGQVQGVQNIEGTPQVLSAAVREVRRYSFKPYDAGDGATPFVTVLNLKWDFGLPGCSLTNPKACL